MQEAGDRLREPERATERPREVAGDIDLLIGELPVERSGDPNADRVRCSRHPNHFDLSSAAKALRSECERIASTHIEVPPGLVSVEARATFMPEG